MSTYKPHQRGHRTLRILLDGPLTFGQVLERFEAPASWTWDAAARKLHLILGALARDGLTRRTADGLMLSAEGLLALGDLDGGIRFITDKPQVSVRIFGAAA